MTPEKYDDRVFSFEENFGKLFLVVNVFLVGFMGARAYQHFFVPKPETVVIEKDPCPGKWVRAVANKGEQISMDSPEEPGSYCVELRVLE